MEAPEPRNIGPADKELERGRVRQGSWRTSARLVYDDRWRDGYLDAHKTSPHHSLRLKLQARSAQPVV